jgi:uncharacterized protein (DUF1330 family)
MTDPLPALIVLNYDVHDHDALMAYRQEATGVVDAPPAAVVTSSATTFALGEGTRTGSHTVILRYPSLDAARDCYESAAYQALVPARLAATIPCAAFLVEVTYPETLAPSR